MQTLACEQDKLLEKIRSTEQEKADQQYTVNLLESTISAATDALRTSLRVCLTDVSVGFIFSLVSHMHLASILMLITDWYTTVENYLDGMLFI